LTQKYFASAAHANLTLYAKWSIYTQVAKARISDLFDIQLSVVSLYVSDSLEGSITSKGDFNNEKSPKKFIIDVSVLLYNTSTTWQNQQPSDAKHATLELLRENNFSDSNIYKSLGISPTRYYQLEYEILNQDRSFIYYTIEGKSEYEDVLQETVSSTVTFNTGNGNPKDPIRFEDGECIALGEIPTRQGYAFISWNYSENSNIGYYLCGAQHGDLILVTSWAESVYVTFNLNGGNGISSLPVETNKTYTHDYFSTPTLNGYVFDGWYTDSKLENSFTSAFLTENITLCAKWLVAHEIKFETNGGSSIDTVVIGEGQTPALDNSPTKPDCPFTGWYSDAELQRKYDTAPVNSNMTLYARWVGEDVILLNTGNFNEFFTVTTSCSEDGSMVHQRVTFSYSIRLKDDAFAQSLSSSQIIKIVLMVSLYGVISTQTLLVEIDLARGSDYFKSRKVSWTAGYELPEYQVYSRWDYSIYSVEGEIALQ
jgi:uncharacterized repeat protein (TIGR02543 family)